MLRRGMAPVLAGLVVGIPLALLATRLLRSLLYEVSASDPVTFVGVAALLAAVALVASWLPARRAARVDPTVTLRAD
jgi:ABC-type lipoprotein release transport system permease subunit